MMEHIDDPPQVSTKAVVLNQSDLPALFQSADESSLQGQHRYLTATRFRLLMLVLAATSSLVGFGEPGSEIVGWAAAAAFALALFAEVSILVMRPERVWHEGRSAAESAKTLAWRYAVGGHPFGIEELDERKADQLLLQRLKEVLRDLKNLELGAALGQEQITDRMRALRAEPFEERRSAYGIGRIEDQRIWYARRAARDEGRARLWMTSMIALEILGVTLGVLRATGTLRVDLLGIAATIAGAIAAWMQVKQHQTQARAYFIAAQELAAIRSEMTTHDTETEWASFVDQAEEAISREHVLWRASRSS
jgi:hypothetical protein